MPQSPAEVLSWAVKPQAGVPGSGTGPTAETSVASCCLSDRLRQHHLFCHEGLGGKGHPRSGSHPTAYLSTSERDVFVCSTVGPPPNPS